MPKNTTPTGLATAIIPRQYRSFLQQNFELKSGSSMQMQMPERTIVNGAMVYITVPYEVGASAPTGLQEAQAYSILNRLVVESSRPDGKKWDINNVAIRKHCSKFKGIQLPEPAFDLATSGGAKELIIPIYLDFTMPGNPFSVYHCGANNYTQRYKIRLDWNENMNGDAGIFTAVNDFAIDKQNIKVQIKYDQHVLPENHDIMLNPSRLLMRNLNQIVKDFTQTGKVFDKLEEKRDYVAIHIAAIKQATSGGLITATDEIFSNFEQISIASDQGSNASTFLRSSWYDLRDHTVKWHNDQYADLEAGYRTFALIDDKRLAQSVTVAAQGDVNLNFDEAKVVSSHDTRLELTYEYLTKQD
ncbi:MAG: hypothetical protein PQ612_06425 [Rickettsiales bacterium]|nr:hypothetical protein [Pseudomonadota bacterium]MDA0966608.1 hypothetical protein [Pseudomonadota bacterium]MDG4543636.1 hypothetical protein [Rickettsiales bacterium]MDG4545783.1 hypothetical protein [Rickettsiales bacterium]MDG4547443.1 hypothetical protein [Rickettsiales bacterium]